MGICTANALNQESVQSFFTINVISSAESSQNAVEDSSEEFNESVEEETTGNEVVEEDDEIIEEDREDHSDSENVEITSEVLSTERPAELEVMSSEEIADEEEPSNEVTNEEGDDNSWENINANTACLFGILCDNSGEGSSEGSGFDGSGDFEEFSSGMSLLSTSPATLVLILFFACLL